MNNDGKLYSYRSDKTVPEFCDDGPRTIMDAHCSLCARGARWIAHNDIKDEFRIIPVQSDLGKALMIHFEIDPSDPASWLYLEDGKAFVSMNAIIRVGQRLGGFWKITGILRLIPGSIQDYLYGVIAKNRYRLFGATDLCSVSDHEIRRRLLQ